MTNPTSTAEQPWPVRTVANLIAGWVNRLGPVWVEGQVTQLNKRPGAVTSFLTLRDPVAEVSLSVTVSRDVLNACRPPIIDGARVVVHGRPSFYLGRGSLSLQAREIRTVGLGELLARIERVKNMLDAEGLFDDSRKRRLPFLPSRVGLICGRESAAQHDVVTNTNNRWPAVEFQIEEVLVQGPAAVGEVIDALARLDRDRNVDVIVITRGGGSVEDLLPFSDEQLLRAVARTATPVVSAIGHEPDAPLLDLVADVRASTPTDAARRIVPDVNEERDRITSALSRSRRCVTSLLEHEQRQLDHAKQQPLLRNPSHLIDGETDRVRHSLDRARRCLDDVIVRANHQLTHSAAQLRALSPAATLERGYAIVQQADGRIVRASSQAHPGDVVHVRVSDGSFDATVNPAVLQ